MDIIKAYATNNLCYIAAKKMTPSGIVVHSTGANNPNLRRYVDAPNELGTNAFGNHWNTAKPGGNNVCVHAFIGYDKNKKVRVAEILPLDICCWGIGSGKNGSYNFDPAYIQFEICEDDLQNEEYYNKVFEVAAQYSAYLCRKFGLESNKIASHKEAHKLGYGSNHSDPEHWMAKFGDSMNEFRKRVDALMKSNDGDKEVELEKPSQENTIYTGDLVCISSDATYYDGTQIPYWVRSQRWYVKEVSSDNRVLIDKNESGTNSILSPIHKKYLSVVEKNDNSLLQNHKCPFRIKVLSDTLNIYTGAGSNTHKAGCIKDNGVYTIIEEKTGIGAILWGKLKSGTGWVPLDNVKIL